MLLLDSDILIDSALVREPYAASANALLAQLRQGRERACMAWHTMSNVHYIVARERGSVFARQFVATLLDFVSVAETGAADVRYALGLPMADFEDALQAAAARACGARSIVTRNVRDFARSPVPAVTPGDALARIGG